jgi:sec-independent protein translocase protein TatB
MFDFSWSELALIAVVALVVIGPKDLPRVMRTVGSWMRRARAMAQEFQGHLEDMAREVELESVRREVEQATSFNVEDAIKNTIDPSGELEHAMSDRPLPDAAADTQLPLPLPLPPPAASALSVPAPESLVPREAETAATHHPAA